MAIADMFLYIQGITGESSADGHVGEIEVRSWTWGMQANLPSYSGTPAGQASMHSLDVVKAVDRSSPTLLQYLNTNKVVSKARLTSRKAATSGPLQYLVMDMTNVRVMSVHHGSNESELTERVSLSFETMAFTYTPQGSSGDATSGGITFTATHPVNK
jgi:type VI secretion system secreted protein Hcp